MENSAARPNLFSSFSRFSFANCARYDVRERRRKLARRAFNAKLPCRGLFAFSGCFVVASLSCNYHVPLTLAVTRANYARTRARALRTRVQSFITRKKKKREKRRATRNADDPIPRGAQHSARISGRHLHEKLPEFSADFHNEIPLSLNFTK